MPKTSPTADAFEELLHCRWLFEKPGVVPALADQELSVHDGKISAVAPVVRSLAGDHAIVLPTLSNAHDHARTFRSSSLDAYARPLENWLPFLGVIPGADPYLCAATSFARTVHGGVSHAMVHYTRVQGTLSYVDECVEVARAARDIGVHIGFAVALRDRQGIAYCEDRKVLAALRPGIRDAVARGLSAPDLPPRQAIERVENVAQAVQEAGLAPWTTVQYGPTGPQWCSDALLQAVAEASAEHGRPVHMHLLETKYQRQWADATYPQGIARHLDSLGLLTPRLTLAHCTWARSDELDLLAQRGVTIAVNTSSNLGLRSGIAPVEAMLKTGCRVAMGLDGLALDEDDDALREMRLGYMLHRGWGFDVSMTTEQLWAFAFENGRRSVTGSDVMPASLEVGAPANLLVIDGDKLDEDNLFPDTDPLDLVLARANRSHVKFVHIDGRRIVDQGKLVSIDEPAFNAELLQQIRSGLKSRPDLAQWHGVLRQLADDLTPFYREGQFLGCC